MDTKQIIGRPVFAEAADPGRFLDALGVDFREAAEATDTDGGIVLAVRDQRPGAI